MTALAEQIDAYGVVIAIGGLSMRVNTTDYHFLEILQNRFAGYISPESCSDVEFDVQLGPDPLAKPGSDLSVTHRAGRWFMQRGDFRAEWDPATSRGTIRQEATPYSLDTALRIVHTLVLARQNGFLLHAASAIRNGKAFLFSGVSGAGKTTISRLAPPDVSLLSDEISYVRKRNGKYLAFGTPFAGELAKAGENTSAPVSALYILHQGPENRVEPLGAADATRQLLTNILFFAQDRELVQPVFQTACDFVDGIPVYRLTFVPNARVWEMIG